MKDYINIEISKLHAFAGHPYKVLDNEEMDVITESVREHGVLSPLIVRPLEDAAGEYEIISGHRRLHAAQRAGLETVPATVHRIDRDAAAIELVDSNLHREHILPSEKAFAYKMKLDAMKRRGLRTDLTSSQVATKFDAAARIGEDFDESRDQVYRYIRLTNLVPELLALMDENRIAFTVGVELSYLPERAQRYIAELAERDEVTPSYSQAVRMHKETGMFFGGIPDDCIEEIMAEDKPNQRERVSIPVEQLRRFFPEGYTPKKMQDAILRMVEDNYRSLPHKKPRDRGDAR